MTTDKPVSSALLRDTPLPCDEGRVETRFDREPQFYVRIATHGNPLTAGWYVVPGFTSARVALMYAEKERAKGNRTVRVVDAYGVEVPADAGESWEPVRESPLTVEEYLAVAA